MPPVALPETIPAPGLEIRLWDVSDAPALGAAIAESIDHLRPFLAWIDQEPMTPQARTALIEGWRDQWRQGGDAVYGIFRDGRVLGALGVHRGDGHEPRAVRPVADDGREIGYWLRSGEEGRGTVTRAVTAVTEAVLALPGITHLEIRHDQANVRSGAIPPRCGYRLVAREQRAITSPGETGLGLLWRIGPDPQRPDPQAQVMRAAASR